MLEHTADRATPHFHNPVKFDASKLWLAQDFEKSLLVGLFFQKGCLTCGKAALVPSLKQAKQVDLVMKWHVDNAR